MATYEELFNIRNNESALKNKVKIAVVIAANDILNEASPSVGRIAWAVSQLSNPDSDNTMFNVVLAENKAASESAILAAPDSGAGGVQTNVDAAVAIIAPA